MTDRSHRPPDALSDDELAHEVAADLPDREALSAIGLGFGNGIDNFAMPINEATAANISSTSSVAAADADQTVIVYQIDDD